MLSTSFINLAAISILGLNAVNPLPSSHLIAAHTMSLEDRQPDKYVNGVFKDNILLNLSYMGNEFTLKPGEAFAFHGDVLPQYEGRIVKTSNAHFNSQEGFKSDGYLVGDGVCHLASLMNLVAIEAKLDTYAPARHDFAVIPDIPKEYGVSIYNYPGRKDDNARQNLYITNSHQKQVTFKFSYNNGDLSMSVFE